MFSVYYILDDNPRMREVIFYNNVYLLNGFNILQHYNFYRLNNDEYKYWSLKYIIVVE